MKELVDKISTYNLFNNLFPGVLFAYIATELTDYNFIQADIFVGVFFYYFIGMIISRIGSLVLEPILKLIKFVDFPEYKDFIISSQKDEKVNEFSEVNNIYRTICAMLLMVLLVKSFENLLVSYNLPSESILSASLVLLAALFLFSYRKQTLYITNRVNKVIENE